MKTLLLLTVILMTAGCATKKEHLQADANQASLPFCSTYSSEIDCQWENVPTR
ncbi:hypothetical protein [Candidatus Pantoea rara]|uniref:hypothetical protein n=1 Tax=Candidatus Pantoea rara TaxID=1947037 RepID=UPI003EB97843